MTPLLYQKWIHNWIDTLSPLEQTAPIPTYKKVLLVAKKIFASLFLLGSSFFVLPWEASRRALSIFTQKKPQGFQAIAKDSRLWATDHQIKNFLTKGSPFSRRILFGVSTSHYQYGGNEKHPLSQWNQPIYPKDTATDTAEKTLAELTKGGISLWNDPGKLLKAIKDIGLQSIRLSIPEELWPDEKGLFSEEAIQTFKERLQLLRENDITILLTLHHFSHPLSFEKQGSFFEEASLSRFYQFAERMYEEFHPYVHEWCTLNEPAVYAVSAYFRGVFPPCEKNFKKMGLLMIQMIKAHNHLYCLFKRKAKDMNTTAPVIGFSHEVIHFKPYSWWNPLTRIVCYILTHIFSQAYLEFYHSGKFSLQVPFLLNMHYEDPDFIKNQGYLDVIQLQCYTRPLIGMIGSPPFLESIAYPHEKMTNFPFREDPASLYEALKTVYEVTKKPVSITEFGCSTNKENQRNRFLLRALRAIQAAIDEDIPVTSVHAWSLWGGNSRAYNEWNESPTRQDFGLYKFEQNGSLTLRQAGKTFRQVIQASIRQESPKRAFRYATRRKREVNSLT